MKILATTWQFWALLAAVFAAMTAILAKLGVATIHPDFATFIRTAVILVVLGAMLKLGGNWQALDTISGRGLTFLVLSGLATGASWLCYFRALKLGNASQVAPVDKLSVVLVAIFAATFLGEQVSPAGWLGITLIASGTILVAVAG